MNFITLGEAGGNDTIGHECPFPIATENGVSHF
jgi:hypothetical protein